MNRRDAGVAFYGLRLRTAGGVHKCECLLPRARVAEVTLRILRRTHFSKVTPSRRDQALALGAAAKRASGAL